MPGRRLSILATSAAGLGSHSNEAGVVVRVPLHWALIARFSERVAKRPITVPVLWCAQTRMCFSHGGSAGAAKKGAHPSIAERKSVRCLFVIAYFVEFALC